MADYLVLEEDGTSRLELEESTDDLLLEEWGGWTDHVVNVNDAVALSDFVVRIGVDGVRVSQLPVEVVVLPSDADARVSQVPVEVVVLPTDANARVTKHTVEVLIGPEPPPARVTLQAVEVLETPITNAVVTAVGVEVLESPDDAAVVVTVVTVEAIYSYTEPPFKPRAWMWL